MLNEAFKALLITSLAGSCLAAVITLAKPITKKVFGYSWHYYIWLAVLVVMILPVRFTLPQRTNIPSVTAVQTVQTEQTEQTVQNTDNIVSDMQKELKTDIWQTGTSFVKKVIDNRLNILAYLWLMGLVLLMLINLIGYIRLITKMRKNSVVVSCPELTNFTDKNVAVRVWEHTSSPFMTGIFRPTLVLPARELSEEQLNNILRHEMTHFKRHDILYKWFVSFVKCVHWFNPVIWYVSAQINTECEISCDMAAVQNMNRSEEMSYIDTVLSLLPTEKTKQIPLTTQTASSKRVLKRRFTMIRNKRRTNKLASALSAMLAAAMLSTTVFASGVLSDLAADDYTIEITNHGEKIELNNKPFIENGEVYLPLRETFEKAGVMEHPDSKIEWNNGNIRVCTAYKINANVYSEDNQGSKSEVNIFSDYNMEIGKPELSGNFYSVTAQYTNNEPLDVTLKSDYIITQEDDVSYSITSSDYDVPNAVEVVTEDDLTEDGKNIMNNAPVMRGDITYVPYSYIHYILSSIKRWQINYSIYDKSGNILELLSNPYNNDSLTPDI